MELRQSTASQSIKIGPFLSSTDGFTAQTGLTIANTDIKLSKNGGTIASKNSGGGTHDAGGWYTITLDATDTNTVGRLQLSCYVSGALPVFIDITILEEAVYDALYATSAGAWLTQISTIETQTNLITSGTILLSTPVGGDGSLLELIKDTDYLNANGRALQWSFDEITGITVAATGKFGIQSVDGTEVYVNSSGVVTEPTAGTFKVSFDIANAALSSLTPGRYDWSVEVLEGTTKITVARNRQIKTRVDIVEKYT